MFSSIGWGEIFTLVIVALLIIGPERLPGLIQDVRAAIFAARRAINNAKAELNGELGPEFEEFRRPMEQVAEYTRMGPRGAITKVLFDGDDEYLDAFDPKKMMEEDPQAGSRRPPQQAQEQQVQQAHPQPPTGRPGTGQNGGSGAAQGNYAQGGGFSWADIT